MKKVNMNLALTAIGMLLILVSAASAQSSALIQQASNYYEDNRGQGRTGENWARVLLAFGQPAPSSAPSNLTPMTANEACANVANWSGWQPFCDELKAIEGAQATPQVFSGEEPYWVDGTNCFWWESDVPQVTVANVLDSSKRVYLSRGDGPQEFIVLPDSYIYSFWHVGNYEGKALPGNGIFRFTGTPDTANIKDYLNGMVIYGFFNRIHPAHTHPDNAEPSGNWPFASDQHACAEASKYFTKHGNIIQ